MGVYGNMRYKGVVPSEYLFKDDEKRNGQAIATTADYGGVFVLYGTTPST